MKKIILSEEQKEMFVSLYTSGSSLEEISESVGINKSSIPRLRKEYGLLTNKTIQPWTKEEEDFIKSNISKMTRKEISQVLGRTIFSVNRKINNMDIPGYDKLSLEVKRQHTRDKQSKYNHNKYFFRNLTLQSSYVAGLIASDGCIYKSANANTYNIHLTLAEQDKDILEQVNKLMENTRPLRLAKEAGKINSISEDGKVYDTQNMWQMKFSNCDLIIKDLEYFYNITPKKTHTLKFPTDLKDENTLAYYIGYVDGDGYISDTSPRIRVSTKYTITVCGASLSWMQDCKEFLERYLDTTCHEITKRKNLYYLSLSRKDAQDKILAFISRNNIPAFPRKWGKIIRDLSIDNVYVYNPLDQNPLKEGFINITPKEFNEKRSLLLSMSGPKEKIAARKTEVRLVSTEEYRNFTNENHLEGFVGAKYKVGLYKDGVLLSVAGFSEYKDANTYELKRFCSKTGFTVVGGLSKIIKGFKRLLPEGEYTLVSFSDDRYSQGKVYETLGFKLEGWTRGLFFWDGEILHNRRGFMKYKLIEKHGFPETMTAKEMASSLGYTQVNIGGNKKWVLSI